ncbi:MAG: NAD(P)/FAD-dependent oxidoreductase [Myxococcota bacterium]
MTNSPEQFEDIVVGSGMAGLATAAMLAHAGRHVLLLEAHDTPGGYCHTFEMGGFHFCAQVHYLFACEEGGAISRLLDRLGLADEIRFVPLDPDGFDHVVVGGERYRIPNGLEAWRDRMVARHPEATRALTKYFELLRHVRDELDCLPSRPTWRDYATLVFRVPHLLRYRRWTLQRVFDRLGVPSRLQVVLAGQSGDYLLPPERVPFLLHAAVVCAYNRGAYYPERHFGHFVECLAAVVRDQPGCEVALNSEVAHILTEGGHVSGVQLTDGRCYRGERVISNVDPATTATLVQPADALPTRYRAKLDYRYSASAFSMYLGVEGLDLTAFGFGNHNVWYYPSDDLNALYRRQLEDHDLSDPWLFISTPTLHSNAPGLAPPGQDVIEVSTGCAYDRFAALRAADPKAYRASKVTVRNTILDRLEASFLPGLRDHLTLRVVGTPATNRRFVLANRGNAYGAELDEDGLRWPRIPYETPVRGLFLVNATAGYPSVGGTIASALALVDRLEERP